MGNRAYLPYILAVPLGTATIIPLGHAVFIHVIVPITIFSLSLFAYDSCRFECCVKKINDLSFFRSFFLVILHKPAAIRRRITKMTCPARCCPTLISILFDIRPGSETIAA